ncbi:MAG: hypothetical protein A2W37_12480 [Chloroflexi bacterium RBG_16_63_12]|nr:MAG: hypothetical protein A2W37_12480 [Chloroflexi bacterium RBG_16_63_12]
MAAMAISMLSFAVRTITSICGKRLRASRISSSPPITGMVRSVTMTAKGSCASSFSRASWPLKALSTS